MCFALVWDLCVCGLVGSEFVCIDIATQLFFWSLIQELWKLCQEVFVWSRAYAFVLVLWCCPVMAVGLDGWEFGCNSVVQCVLGWAQFS